ncbi:PD-(D/E)XK nuclease family protein [Lysinibacter cavernae]|uniref:PD-(D/E)XK nuclease family protein n=1 Tax=Lysinibacter cavernae TaxID=1640652 RepID=UPI003615CA1A
MEELKGLEWHGTHLTSTEEKHFAKASRKSLAPTVAQKINSCPAQFFGAGLLPFPDGPFEANTLGTDAHSIIEQLLAFEGPLRTSDNALNLILEEAESRYHSSLDPNLEDKSRWVEEMKTRVLGVFTTNNVDITSWNIFGLEYDVANVELPNGVISQAKIDIVRHDPNGGLIVGDWKFGQYKAPNPRFGDAQGDQLRNYSTVLELSTKQTVNRAELIFPVAGQSRLVSLDPKSKRLAQNELRTARNTLDNAMKTRRFEAAPSALCGWCPLVNSCPVKQVEKANAIESALTKPSKVELGIPVFEAGSRPVTPGADLSNPSTISPVTESSQSRSIDGTPSPYIDKENVTIQNGVLPMTTTATTEVAIRPSGLPSEETSQGLLNFNSYAAGAVSDIVSLAVSQLDKANQTLSGDTIKALSSMFATLVNRVQYRISGTASWQQGTNNRVRFFVKNAIATKPIPFGGSEDDWVQWLGRAENLSIHLMETATEIHARGRQLEYTEIPFLSANTTSASTAPFAPTTTA